MKNAVLLLLLGVFAIPVFAKSIQKQNCFGAVGKQCAVPGSVKGKPSPLNMVACSKVEKGQTNCWISPGSIEHDNCCLKHPNGVMCSSETKNDGSCAKEWEEVYKDITQKTAWYHIYNVKEEANLSFVPSKRMKKFGGQEAESTAALCAPGGTKILAHYDNGFCCAGKAKKQGAVMICAQESVAKKPAPSKKSQELAKKSQEFLKKSQDAFNKLNNILKGAGVSEKKLPQSPQTVAQKLSKSQKAISDKPAEQKWPELSAQEMMQAKKWEGEMKEFEQKAKEFEQKEIAAQPALAREPAAPQQKIAMKPQAVPPPPPQLPPLPEQYRKPLPSQQQIVQQKNQLPSSQPQPQSQPVASRPIGTQTTFDYGNGPNMPPPSPMPEEQDELEQPTYYEEPAPPSEPMAQRQPEAPVEEARPSCSGGAWSPTLGTCVEDKAEEVAAPPDCGAGAHWSPTLQSCQAD